MGWTPGQLFVDGRLARIRASDLDASSAARIHASVFELDAPERVLPRNGEANVGTLSVGLTRAR